jgi:hypothetical protein
MHAEGVGRLSQHLPVKEFTFSVSVPESVAVQAEGLKSRI